MFNLHFFTISNKTSELSSSQSDGQSFLHLSSFLRKADRQSLYKTLALCVCKVGHSLRGKEPRIRLSECMCLCVHVCLFTQANDRKVNWEQEAFAYQLKKEDKPLLPHLIFPRYLCDRTSLRQKHTETHVQRLMAQIRAGLLFASDLVIKSKNTHLFLTHRLKANLRRMIMLVC